jgi:hypothetical protein
MEGGLAGYSLRVCEILNKHEVEYLIVGGLAMALHGYYRRSIAPDGTQAEKPDIDIGLILLMLTISGCPRFSRVSGTGPCVALMGWWIPGTQRRVLCERPCGDKKMLNKPGVALSHHPTYLKENP